VQAAAHLPTRGLCHSLAYGSSRSCIRRRLRGKLRGGERGALSCLSVKYRVIMLARARDVGVAEDNVNVGNGETSAVIELVYLCGCAASQLELRWRELR
jgi:hypothetical protein